MNEYFIGYLLGYAILFLISVFITRAIFSIGTIVRQLTAQTDLLAHIALKSGVNVDTVNTIHAASRNSVYVKPAEKTNDAADKQNE